MTDGIRWKNGARCAVTLSFDVDGESPWILSKRDVWFAKPIKVAEFWLARER
jgi:hypothetical protein